MNSGEHLCLACGLCCDGTLFDHVRLGPGDDARALRALGLPVVVTRTTPPIRRALQPCSALCADRSCRLYADRPSQCRAFECRVFQEHAAGRLTSAAALRLVKQGRRRADQVRRLLRRLGDHDGHRPLAERFRRTQRRLEAGDAGPAEHATLADLGLAMHRMNLLAFEKFHVRADAQ